MHHAIHVPAHVATRPRAPLPALLSLAAVGILGLSACGDAPAGTPSSAATPQTQGSQAPATEESEPADSDTEAQSGAAGLSALSEEQMMEALVGPGDLPEAPTGHSTHTGIDYFHEEIAVEFEDYRDRFGPGDCAAVMDSINVDLIGDGADDGLMHMYRLPAEGDINSLLYVWVLAYDRDVDTTEVWEQIEEHCLNDQLRNDTDSVDVAAFDAGGFTGVQLGISSEFDGGPEDFTTFSAAIDAGENLVMMSSVGVEEDRFREILQTQEQKLAALHEPAG